MSVSIMLLSVNLTCRHTRVEIFILIVDFLVFVIRELFHVANQFTVTANKETDRKCANGKYDLF